MDLCKLLNTIIYVLCDCSSPNKPKWAQLHHDSKAHRKLDNIKCGCKNIDRRVDIISIF